MYVVVTLNLYDRIQQLKDHTYQNRFTDTYNLEYCIYYEIFLTIEEAILPEKQIKKYRRDKKEKLINSINPHWSDLWSEIQHW